MVTLAWFASLAFPLLTYTTTLAAFGLPHVAEEMRWLGGRLPDRATWAPVVPMLGLVMAVRAARFVDGIPAEVAQMAELAVAIGVVWAPWRLWRDGRGLGPPLVTAALLLGLLLDPVLALLAVAVVHNWTPVPLVAHALTGAARRRFLVGSVVVFGLLPLALATGLPAALLPFGDPDLRVLPSGPLVPNLTAYLPRAWATADAARHVFSAIVFAQCLHYLAVLGVMSPRAPRPHPAWWPGLVVASVLTFLAFAFDFHEARAAYGVVSSAHAWVEVPVVLWLMTARPPRLVDGSEGRSRR